MSSQVTSWKRLEPRYRLLDVRPGLSRPLGDPAWMLLRQWQVGEFEGSDGGSPLLFEVDASTSMLTRFHKGKHPGGVRAALFYDPTLGPLDPLVEQEAMHAGREGALSPLLMVYAAERFFEMLMQALSAVGTTREDWRTYLLGELSLACRDWNEPEDDQHNHALSTLLSRGTLIDGRKLYTLIRDDLEDSGGTYLASDSLLVRGAQDYNDINAVVLAWRDWVDTLVRSDEGHDEATSWDTASLSYQFAVGAKDDQNQEYVLGGSSRGETLDWYSFDRKDSNASLSSPSEHTSTTLKRLMSPLRFPGTESPRFWTMDDRRTAFAGVDATTMQLSRSLWMDFVLTMGQSWSIVPLEFPVGSITALSSARMSTTFDAQVPLPVLGQEPGQFRVFVLEDESTVPPSESHIYLPPVTTRRQESAPVETLHLVRDETQNVAWAIESTVAGSAGHPRHRHETWQKRREQLEAEFKLSLNDEALVYELSNRVPDFWYPMLPQVTRNTNGLITDMMLKQGRLLTRPLEAHPPEGTMFEGGFSLPDTSIPAKGRLIHRRDRGARWSDGRLHIWRGRERLDRSPQTDSGLVFDQLKWTAPEPTSEPLPHTYEDLHGDYPWSLLLRFDAENVTTQKGHLPVTSGDAPTILVTPLAHGAKGCAVFEGTGHLSWGKEDVNVDYMHQYARFSVLLIATRVRGTGFMTLFSTTQDDTLPGIKIWYDADTSTCRASLSNSVESIELVSNANPFDEQGVARLVLTCDGEHLSLWDNGVLLATQDITALALSSDEGGAIQLAGNASGSSRWQGCVGALGIMPRPLSFEEITGLVSQLKQPHQWKENVHVWWSARDPFLCVTDAALDTPAQVGEEVVVLLDKGAMGLRLESTPVDKGHMVKQGNGVWMGPSVGEGNAWRLEDTFPEPLDFEQDLTLKIVFETNQLGSHPLVSLFYERNGTEVEGFFLGALPQGIEWKLGDEEGQWTWDEPTLLSSLQYWTVSLNLDGRLTIFVDEGPQPIAQRPARPILEGTWNTDLGELKLKQLDDVVWGDLDDHGTLQARVDRVTGQVVGEFYDTTAARGGNFVWQWDGESFTGLWAWDELTPANTWNGTLTDGAEPTLTQWPVSPPSFEGSFDSGPYGIVKLRQAGNRVWGDYIGGQGELEGVLDFDTGVLEGTFYRHDISLGGRFQFTLSANGFTGLWNKNLDPLTRTWNGTRIDAVRPSLEQWSMWYPYTKTNWTKMVVGYSDRTSRVPLEGTWNTDLGELKLKQRDDVVWGDLDDHGTIQARFDLLTGEVVGEFYDTTAARGGNFVWQWDGESFTGLWAWDELTPANTWNGTLTDGAEPTLTQWPVSPPSFEGSFDSGPYGIVKLRQAGNRVWGDYYGGEGHIEGVLDFNTGVLEGTFYRHDISIGGRIRFTWTANGFSGLWATGTAEPFRPWSGSRIDALPPALKQWPTWHGQSFSGALHTFELFRNVD